MNWEKGIPGNKFNRGCIEGNEVEEIFFRVFLRT